MYSVRLKIAFLGIAEDQVELWKGIAPKERFSHSFYTIQQEKDMIRELADEEQLLVIMDQASSSNDAGARQPADSVCG